MENRFVIYKFIDLLMDFQNAENTSGKRRNTLSLKQIKKNILKLGFSNFNCVSICEHLLIVQYKTKQKVRCG